MWGRMVPFRPKSTLSACKIMSKMLLLQRGNARPGGIKEEHQDLAEGEQLQLRLAGRALLCVGGNGAQLDGQEIDTGGKGAYHP